MTKQSMESRFEKKLERILPMGGFVPLDTSDKRRKIGKLLKAELAKRDKKMTKENHIADIGKMIKSKFDFLDKLYTIYHKGRTDKDCEHGECDWDEVVGVFYDLLKANDAKWRARIEGMRVDIDKEINPTASGSGPSQNFPGNEGNQVFVSRAQGFNQALDNLLKEKE